jgi:hypothetical protein
MNDIAGTTIKLQKINTSNNNGYLEIAATRKADEQQVNVYGKLPPIIVQPELQLSLPRTQCFQQPLELRLSIYGSRLKLEWVAELF